MRLKPSLGAKMLVVVAVGCRSMVVVVGRHWWWAKTGARCGGDVDVYRCHGGGAV